MMHSSGVWEADLRHSGARMFDYVRVSANIGPLTNVQCETESLGCKLCRYWVSPAGQLFVIDYEGTHDFVLITESDPEYDHQFPWRNTDVVKNGCHGAVAPVSFTGALYLKPAAGWDKGQHYHTLYFQEGLCDSLQSGTSFSTR